MTSLEPSLGEETGLLGQPKTEEDPEEAIPAPAPKKNRTNTPWSPAEEQRLRIMRDANKSWGEIAKVGYHPGALSVNPLIDA